MSEVPLYLQTFPGPQARDSRSRRGDDSLQMRCRMNLEHENV